MIEAAALALSTVTWDRAVRIIRSAHPQIRKRLAELGYRTVAEPRRDALWLCTDVDDDADAAHVRQGGRMLLPPEADIGLTPFLGRRTNKKSKMNPPASWDRRLYAQIILVIKKQSGRLDRDTAPQANFGTSVTNAVLQVRASSSPRRAATGHVTRSRYPDLAPQRQAERT